MKNKVFALGNALVDHEYQVTEKQLTNTKLNKGSAQLAMSLAEQQELIAYLSDENVALVKKAGGGSAANTVFAIAALGGSSSISCRVSDDDAGRFYLQDLTNAGVKTSIKSLSSSAEPTGSCMVLVNPDAERTMQSYLGVSAHFGFEHVDESLLNRAEYLYIEGYLAASELAVDAVKQTKKLAKENDIKIALSFADPSMVNFCKDGLLAMLDGGVDIIFCNQEEATTFANAESLDDAITHLHEYAEMVVITMGADGAMVSEKSGASFTTPAASVDKVIDTNGAGDNFAGAFMYGITNDMGVAESAKLAVTVAGKLIAHFGPRMPAEDYAQLLAEFSQS